MSSFLISVVNPRFNNFNKPLLLAVCVGALTFGATGGYFALQVTSKQCNSLNYPTPVREVKTHWNQYIGGFNDQVEYAQSLRFADGWCWDGERSRGECGVGKRYMG